MPFAAFKDDYVHGSDYTCPSHFAASLGYEEIAEQVVCLLTDSNRWGLFWPPHVNSPRAVVDIVDAIERMPEIRKRAQFALPDVWRFLACGVCELAISFVK